MEWVFKLSLCFEEQVRTARSFLRNIYQYAIDERLELIAAALPLFAKNCTRIYPSLDVADYRANVSGVQNSASMVVLVWMEGVVAGDMEKEIASMSLSDSGCYADDECINPSIVCRASG
jgi:hypothetical protein